MSMNNFANRPAARDMRAQKSVSVAEAIELAREDRVTQRSRWEPWKRFISVRGLAALTNTAAAEWAAQGADLPWNIDGLTSTGFSPELDSRHGRWLQEAEAGALLQKHARFGGWLKAARTLPGLRRLVQKTQSVRGTGSPRTRVNLWALAQRFPSPGAFERRLWAAKVKAEAVLSAYHGGHKPSWANLANALMLEARPNKAGLITAAGALGRGVYWDWHSQPRAEYRAARDWLVEHRSAAFPVADATDGVVCHLAATPVMVKLGITVTKGLVIDDYGRREIILFVRKGERTFHSDRFPEGALQDSIVAWRKQDALAATHSDLVGFLRGGETGICPLVYRQDSYTAGNCSPGTEAWLRRLGFANRQFIPGVWLMPHLADERVRRVAAALKRELVHA